MSSNCMITAPYSTTSSENPNTTRFSKRLRDYLEGTDLQEKLTLKTKQTSHQRGLGRRNVGKGGCVLGDRVCWLSSHSVLSSS